jgi:cell division protein FtsW (lipid II flippase)
MQNTSTRNTLVFELLLTLLVAGFLAWLAVPLGDEAYSSGLGDRYQQDFGTPAEAQADRALDLAENLPSTLATLALGGWIALRLARSHLSRRAVVCFQVAVWLGVWAMAYSPNDAVAGPRIWAAWACAALGAAVTWATKQNMVKSHVPVHALAYPGWVLFTGLGLVWLVDYSARSYAKWRFLALGHADTLLLAYGVMTMLAACSTQLAGLLSRIFAAWDKATTTAHGITLASRVLKRLAPLSIPLIFALWTVAVVLVFGKSRPALTSELLRLPFFLVGGWMLYRWAMQGQGGRAFVGASVGVLVATAGLAGTGDFGQVLLIGLGLAIACGTAVALLLGGSRPALLAGVLAAVALISFGLQLINDYGHQVSRHIGWRAEALVNPFAGRLEYLSELRWFAASTPWDGHGPTQVPWCGTLGSLDATLRCTGVPKEMHSDYVFQGIAGVWGAWGAALITGALALWLVSLVQVGPATRVADPKDLGHWVVACFAAVTLAQLLFTTLGSLGLVALTGITYPLVGLGSSSLLVCAGFAGMAMRR